MSEFTNYDADIHVTRYLKEQEEARKSSPNETPISRMRNYCSGGTSFKYDQEPVLFKPMIKDIIHGGTYDRVFSKTATFKSKELRCSDGLVMPKQFLDLMSTKQREQAFRLFDKGLLVVSICSATTFFSRQNKQLKQAKTATVQSNIMKAFLPADIAQTEVPHQKSGQNMPRKIFVKVVQLAKEDHDLIKVPHWIIKTLGMAAGQPLAVSLPKWPGSLHFYDAKSVELTPLSPNYYLVVEKYENNPEKMYQQIQKALGHHSVLTHGTNIDLCLEGRIIQAKIKLLSPSQQLWLINKNPEELQIGVRITQQLEKLASLQVTSHEKMKRDNAKLLKEGLDLNQVMRSEGLDLELMEQMEQEHLTMLDKVKNMTFKPMLQNHIGPVNTSALANTQGSHDKIKLFDSTMMDQVTEEAESPTFNRNDQARLSMQDFTNQTFMMDQTLRDSQVRKSRRNVQVIDAQAQLVQSGEEGALSNLWPTVKIKNRSPIDMQTQVYVGNPSAVGNLNSRLPANRRFKAEKSQFNPQKLQTRGKASSMPPSHQLALERQIHNLSPSILRLDSKDNLALYQQASNEEGKVKRIVLSQLPKKTTMQPHYEPNQYRQKGVVVPVTMANMNMQHHQTSIVTASIDQSSQRRELDLLNSVREEKKTSILTILKGDLGCMDYNSMRKLSMTHNSNQAQSKKNIGQKTSVVINTPSDAHAARRPLIAPGFKFIHKDNNSSNEIYPGFGSKAVQLKTRINLDNAQSNQDLLTVKDDDFLDMISRDLSGMGTESADKLIKTMQYEVMQDYRYHGLKKNQTLVNSDQTRQLSNNSPSNNDIQSELMAEVGYGESKLPVYYRNDGNHQDDLNNNLVRDAEEIQEAELNHISSSKLSEYTKENTIKTVRTQRSSLLANCQSKGATGGGFRQKNNAVGKKSGRTGTKALERSQTSGRASILANNRVLDSQQSVFERLTTSRNMVKSIESVGGEEFKNVLKIIENANPEQYRYLAQRQNTNIQLCSKKHKNDRAIQFIDSKLYKLDENEQTNRQGPDLKQRARSCYTRKRKRSLASQLKYNDLLLQRGVMGSPVAVPISSHCFLKETLNVTLTGDQATAVSSNPTTTLIINYEQDQSSAEHLNEIDPNKRVQLQLGSTKNDQPAKILMLGTDGSKLLSVSELEDQTKVLSLQLGSNVSDKHKDKGMQLAHRRDSRNQVQRLASTVPVQGPAYKAVTNRKFNYGTGAQSLGLRRKSALSVKTGQLSKLFQQYNRQITEQRQAIDQFASNKHTRCGSGETTPYRVDAEYREKQGRRSGCRKNNRNRSRRRTNPNSYHLQIEEQQTAEWRKVVTKNKTTADIQSNNNVLPTQSAVVGPTETYNESISCQGNTQYQSQYRHSKENEDLSQLRAANTGTVQLSKMHAPTENRDDTVLRSSPKDKLLVSDMQNMVDAAFSNQEIPHPSSIGDRLTKHFDQKVVDSIEVDETVIEDLAFTSLASQGGENNVNAFMTQPVLMVDSLHQVNSAMRSSQAGDLYLNDVQPAVDPTFGKQQAVIEVNVNRLDVQQLKQPSPFQTLKHGQESAEKRQRVGCKRSSKSAMGDLKLEGVKDGRVNHDCFPVKRYSSKRASILSNKTGLYPISPTNHAVDSTPKSGRQSTITCKSFGKRHKSRKQSTAVQDALSVNLASGQTNLGAQLTTANGPSFSLKNEQLSDSEQLKLSAEVQQIPNLAIDKILVRSKKPDDQQQHQLLLNRQSDLTVNQVQETTQSVTAKREEQHERQRQSLMNHLGQSLEMRASFSPINQTKDSNPKVSSKIKWQIIKQKVVASPSSHDSGSAVFNSNSHIKYHKRQQSSTVGGRRVKALKTLVQQPSNDAHSQERGIADLALISPRTDFSQGQKWLDTSKMVLSQRSMGQQNSRRMPSPPRMLLQECSGREHM